MLVRNINRLAKQFLLLLLSGIPVGSTCSVVGLKTCTLTTGVKKYKSLIKKKRKKYNNVFIKNLMEKN